MSTVNIFEFATRNKLSFATQRHANLTVSDLWDLSLTDLDLVAKTINRQIRATEEESFLTTNKTEAGQKVLIGLEVVKHIIAVKEADAKARVEKVEKNAKRSELLEALAAAEKAERLQKTPQQLRAELAKLDD